MCDACITNESQCIRCMHVCMQVGIAVHVCCMCAQSYVCSHPLGVCEELSADALVRWTAAHRVSVSEYSWAQFGCQHNNVLGSILGEEGASLAGALPSLLWIMTSTPPQLLPLAPHRLNQVAGPMMASSGNCCPRAMRRRPPAGRGRDKGPGWASRHSAGPIPLEDELWCPLAHMRLLPDLWEAHHPRGPE